MLTNVFNSYSYIIELLNFKFQTHGHNLCSTQDTLALQIPQIRTKVTLGDRSFLCAAPGLWNKLPVDIRKSQTLESENLFVLNIDLASLWPCSKLYSIVQQNSI